MQEEGSWQQEVITRLDTIVELLQRLLVYRQFEREQPPAVVVDEQAEAANPANAKSVESLIAPLRVRQFVRALENKKIYTLGALCRLTPLQVASMTGIGKTSMLKLRKFLQSEGLDLKAALPLGEGVKRG
jgi:DNA-directed RNA polymerase alpha subunit